MLALRAELLCIAIAGVRRTERAIAQDRQHHHPRPQSSPRPTGTTVRAPGGTWREVRDDQGSVSLLRCGTPRLTFLAAPVLARTQVQAPGGGYETSSSGDRD